MILDPVLSVVSRCDRKTFQPRQRSSQAVPAYVIPQRYPRSWRHRLLLRSRCSGVGGRRFFQECLYDLENGLDVLDRVACKRRVVSRCLDKWRRLRTPLSWNHLKSGPACIIQAMPSTESDLAGKVDAIASEPMVGIPQNEWTACIGIDGRHDPDYARIGTQAKSRYCRHDQDEQGMAGWPTCENSAALGWMLCCVSPGCITPDSASEGRYSSRSASSEVLSAFCLQKRFLFLAARHNTILSWISEMRYRMHRSGSMRTVRAWWSFYSTTLPSVHRRR